MGLHQALNGESASASNPGKIQLKAFDFDRRFVLGGLLGSLATVANRPARALSEGPPMFESVRHQFTILRPSRSVASVELKRIDGSRINLASFSGKAVLINFWATWCAACQIELPILERLQGLRPLENLHVLAVSLDQDPRRSIPEFLRRIGIRKLDVCIDPTSRLAKTESGAGEEIPFPLYGMPISYVIGTAGELEGYMTGWADWSSKEGVELLSYYANGS